LKKRGASEGFQSARFIADDAFLDNVDDRRCQGRFRLRKGYS